jgi:hypothetical protein
MPEDMSDRPLTIHHFVVCMNAVLIELYADFGREKASDMLTDLANRLHGIAVQVEDPINNAVIGGLATALMMTEDGG